MIAAGTNTKAEVAALRRARPKSPFLRTTAIVIVAFTTYAWFSGEIEVGALFRARRLENLERFVTRDIVPFPLREQGLSVGGAVDWAGGLMREQGWKAMLATLWISVLAIALAGAFALVIMPLASGSLMTREPYLLRDGTRGVEGRAWRALVLATRFGLIFLRAIPEYAWAFVFLAMLGPTAWVAVLALAIHNGGILGRLYGDTVENLEVRPLRSLRMLGATRRQISAVALLPLGLPRMLLYFFYRFETCVREATVLGLLGVISLGYFIQEARARQFYDEMLLLVALGVVIVLIGDLVSYAARAWTRRA
ncbi:MAG: ABC transporter permease subunit [bacterium]|nr:ABC transporter permease subunit [bacterium]